MEKILNYIPLLLEGGLGAIKLFLVTLALSLPLGLPLALGSTSKFKPLKWLCQLYILVFRGTPLLLQLYFFYFILPFYGLEFSAFVTACITFVLNYAAYLAEIYRGGINSIDNGQFEAAHALGLSRKQTMLDIILPQTMKAILPPVANEAIILIKDTALASTITFMELLKVSRSLVNLTSDPTPYLLAGIFYLILTLILTKVTSMLEKHFSRYDALEEF